MNIELKILNKKFYSQESNGMNYYIHVSGAGMIDSISSSRGGLR